MAQAEACVRAALELEEAEVLKQVELVHGQYDFPLIPTTLPVHELKLCAASIFEEDIKVNEDNIPFDAPLYSKYAKCKKVRFKQPKIHRKLSRRLLRTKN